MTRVIGLFRLMARLDFRRFHRNCCASNGSSGLHRTTFQPFSSQRISKYYLHFRFHLMARLPLNSSRVDCTSDLIFLLDSTGLQVLTTRIWLRVLDMCHAFAPPPPTAPHPFPNYSLFLLHAGVLVCLLDLPAWEKERKSLLGRVTQNLVTYTALL